MSVKVYKDGYDWMFGCTEHPEIQGFFDEWFHALEGAYGHAAIAHPSHRPVWEVAMTDGTYAASVLVIANRSERECL